jgi:hypothetical protein
MAHQEAFRRLDRARLFGPMTRQLLALGGVVFLVAASVFATSEGAAQTAKNSKPGVHVYLFRGWMNVFSTGMDELGNKLVARGVPASVWNHMLVSSAASDAIQNYKSGKVRTVIAVGHSMGAAAVIAFVDPLGSQGVPVAVAVTLDGTSATIPGGRVSRFMNLYIAGGIGGPMTKGPRFSGNLSNINIAKMRDIGHLNIDKLPSVHNMIFGYINQARAGGAPPAAPSAASTSAPPASATPASAPAAKPAAPPARAPASQPTSQQGPRPPAG